jgi:hypothetical protein
MAADSTSTWKILSRKQWVDALRRHVCAEVEPVVRRSEPRFDVVIGGCRLMYQDPGGAAAVTAATLIQVSASGAMLRIHVEVPVGQLVSLECPLYAEGAAVNGVVAHTTSTVGAYKVGLELRFAPESDDRDPPGGSRGKPRTPITTRPLR